jgi:hypothetical protein
VYSKGEALWTFSNGATLKLRHLWDAQAAEEVNAQKPFAADATQ